MSAPSLKGAKRRFLNENSHHLPFTIHHLPFTIHHSPVKTGLRSA
ncbi:MAG TPA: hypothetical protein PKL94_12255 [Saprospiraceae bacterium]|nr:hypothetical protein [Saprospiraceae bacterium]